MNELGLIHDGAVLIRDGVIEQVGPTRRVENLAEARDAIEIDARGKVVMPGLVDCHTHLMFPAQPHGGEEGDHLARAARSVVATTTPRLALRGRGYLQMMARHGTTTIEAKSGCGPNASAELKVLRVLHSLHKQPLDIVPSFLFRLGAPGSGAELTDAASAEAVFHRLMFSIRRRRLARFADLQWDTEAARRPLLHRFLDAALSLGFGCKIHADQHSCGAAVSLAVERGVASIDHLEYATLDQARLLAAAGTIAVLLPGESFQHGHHAPARSLLDAGVAVALGSNFNPFYCPSFNMQTVIALACRQMAMTPSEAITAATINAAHAIGVGHRFGSLECDKLADVLILDTADYRDLGQHLGTNFVHTVIKRGVVLPRA